jgi:hypothetical protein
MVAIVLQDSIRIPRITNLESFRRWARTDQYPEHGWYSYLQGELWADQSGWMRSSVFGKSFRLVEGVDPLGEREFTLKVR